MTKDEFNRIVGETKVSTLCSYSDDPLRDLLAEIYFEGYRDGFKHIKGIVDNFEPRIFGCNSEKFFEKNMDKINRRVQAISDLEKE